MHRIFSDSQTKRHISEKAKDCHGFNTEWSTQLSLFGGGTGSLLIRSSFYMHDGNYTIMANEL